MNPIYRRNVLITILGGLAAALLGVLSLVVQDAAQASQLRTWAAGLVAPLVTLWMRSGKAPILPPVPELPIKGPTVIDPAKVSRYVGALCLVLLCSGCGALGASLGAAAIDCSAPTLAGQIGGLLVRVQEILRGGEPDWAAQLDQLALGGREALACAVGRVASQPGRPAGVGPASAEDEAPRLAAQYLASRRLAVRP